MNNLNICKQTRQIAADSLKIALEQLLAKDDPISEIDLRDAWLFELRKHENIFPDGWYMPPPHGIGILFGTPEDTERINYPTLRTKEYWPRSDVFLDTKDGIIVTYSSATNKQTGTIGDFGLNIYFGKDEKIIAHFKNVYSAVKQSFSEITIGMKLSELFAKEYAIFLDNDLTNEGWVSTSDPTGINTGHTVPILEQHETETLKKENWENICNLISQKRRFVNSIEEASITPGGAVTIEARLRSTTDNTIPTIYFHTIAVIHENGEKELLTNFDEIFAIAGMDYLL